jgi:hypothetical protein
MTNLELFAVYGMEMRYPYDWRAEIRSKSRRDKGDVIFTSLKGERIFASWGPLALVSKRFPVLEKHADHSFDNIKKMQNVKSLEFTDRRRVQINGHSAVFTRAKVKLGQRLMIKKFYTDRDVQSIHLHCDNSGRYFIVYNPVDDAVVTPEDRSDVDLLDIGTRTLKCHDV